MPMRIIIACTCQSVGMFIGSSVTSLIEMTEYRTVEERVYGYLIIFTMALVMVRVFIGLMLNFITF
jgi:hypothetical protein